MFLVLLMCRNADKIKAPLLLMHGEEDNNPGTFPMQSERFYQVRALFRYSNQSCLGLGMDQ